MRIISKFHDYYDSAMAYGYDDDGYIYLRKEEDIPKEEVKSLIGDELYSDIHNSGFMDNYARLSYHEFCHRIVIIGFCGKIYPMIEIVDPRGTSTKQHYFIDTDEAISWIKKNLDEKYLDYFAQNKKYRKWFSRGDKSSIAEKYDAFYRRWNAYDFSDIFINHGTPVFSYAFEYQMSAEQRPNNSYRFTINPSFSVNFFICQ